MIPSSSYRAADFLAAASALRLTVIVATDGDVPLGLLGGSRSVAIDFDTPEASAAKLADISPMPSAFVAADDRGVVIAAMASHLLGLPANPVGATLLTRDKAHMRGLLKNASVPQPEFRLADEGEVAPRAVEIGFPCVVKPRGLSASQGVIRVDTESEARFAEERVRNIVESTGGDRSATLLVESFVDGSEAAVEGMLVDGRLVILAILDKPEPMDGPFFEETILVTPSRLPDSVQRDIQLVTESATRALGLISGPIHAEVRCGTDGVVLLEVAARSIGGLCGRALTFGMLGESLESLIIRAALGLPGPAPSEVSGASGVMMIPIAEAGVLEAIDGVPAALAVDGVTRFDQTIAVGKPMVPLPEGNRYLGFLFAEAASPAEVEHALRAGFEALTISVA